MTDACDSRNAITDCVPLKDAFLPFGQLFPPGEKPFQAESCGPLSSEWVLHVCSRAD